MKVQQNEGEVCEQEALPAGIGEACATSDDCAANLLCLGEVGSDGCGAVRRSASWPGRGTGVRHPHLLSVPRPGIVGCAFGAVWGEARRGAVERRATHEPGGVRGKRAHRVVWLLDVVQHTLLAVKLEGSAGTRQG